uniref:F-box domain-containing protein n=1 Tax=Caenorhabditis tropicalis TaxID=1561998 RepID=A0A1I7TVN1_9PELO
MTSELEEKLRDLNISNTISSLETFPNLCDLPLEIVEMIVERLDLRGRVIAGRVCKTFRIMTDLLGTPRRCDDLKITIGPERSQVIINGYTIDYKRPEGENDEECRKIMIGKMLDDFLPLINDCQLNFFSARFDDYLSNILFHDVFQERSKPLKAHTLICKGFHHTHRFIETRLVDWASPRFREYHQMEKQADDIIKVNLRKIQCSGIMPNPWLQDTVTETIKYFREGQEDIYVDEPNLVPPKKQ